MTRAQYERCRLQGLAARQGGRPAEANPYAGKASLRRQAQSRADTARKIDKQVRREAKSA